MNYLLRRYSSRRKQARNSSPFTASNMMRLGCCLALAAVFGRTAAGAVPGGAPVPGGAAPVTLDLFVASKCPDASRCENAFLPTVLRAVGDLLDVRLGFIGTVNESAPFGVECMHGDDECAGNVVQLCAQHHFPTNVGADTGGLDKRHAWTRLLGCVGHFNHTNESAIPAALSGIS